MRFEKGSSKEELARRYRLAAEREGRTGVYLIGVAQERASVWRGWRSGARRAHPWFSLGRRSSTTTTSTSSIATGAPPS